MHVLIVLDHPNPESFSAAAAQRFAEGATNAGHTTETADLHAEGFDPRWSLADIEADGGGTAPADVIREQTRIARADAICMVFPLYWWGMPAMTKGWIDRVWSWGWAYDQLANPEISLQRPRTGVLLIPAGSSSAGMAAKGYLASLETAWTQGTFGYFGFSPRKLEVLYGASGSAERREALLQQAFDAGAGLAAPNASHN